MRKILLSFLALALIINVSFAGYHVLVNRLANKLEAKVMWQSITKQVVFLDKAIDILDRHSHKHPVIPLLIDELALRKNKLTAPATQPNKEGEYDMETTILVTELPHVDIQRVRETWLKRVNDARAKKWLTPYVLDSKLDATAQEWANTLSTKWPHLQWWRPQWGTHWRNSASEWYYNYEIITQWFADRGITPAPTENVFYRGYSCKSGDCTDALLASMKKWFDFFINEGPWGAHHDTQMSPTNTKFWMGIAHERGFKIWAVFHVGK